MHVRLRLHGAEVLIERPSRILILKILTPSPLAGDARIIPMPTLSFLQRRHWAATLVTAESQVENERLVLPMYFMRGRTRECSFSYEEIRVRFWPRVGPAASRAQGAGFVPFCR